MADVLTPYQLGFASGRDGPNTVNCRFTIFINPAGTAEWERGRAAFKVVRKVYGAASSPYRDTEKIDG